VLELTECRPIGSEPRAAAHREPVQHDADAAILSMDAGFNNVCQLGNHYVLVSHFETNVTGFYWLI
jgi:hypothetical protein